MLTQVVLLTVEEKYLASNPVTSSAHLQAFVIDIDPTKFAASAAHRVMRKSNLAPKRVTLGEPLASLYADIKSAYCLFIC